MVTARLNVRVHRSGLMTVAAVLLCVFVLSSPASALFSSRPYFTYLNKDNYEKTIYTNQTLGSKAPIWVVVFMDNSCPACKSIENSFNAAADQLVAMGAANIGIVDAVTFPKPAAIEAIRHVPTIKLFHTPSALNEVYPNSDNGFKAPEFLHWVLRKLPGRFLHLTPSNFDAFASNQVPRFILFSDKWLVSGVLRSASLHTEGMCHWGIVESSSANSKPILEKMGVVKTPALFFIGHNGTLEDAELLPGIVSITRNADMMSWIRHRIVRSEGKEIEPLKPTSPAGIVETTQENSVPNAYNKQIWVAWNASKPGDMHLLGRRLQHRLDIFSVNCTAQQEACEYAKVKYDPEVRVYPGDGTFEMLETVHSNMEEILNLTKVAIPSVTDSRQWKKIKNLQYELMHDEL